MSAERHILIEEIASDWSEFETKLTLGDLPMPCWVEIGDSGFRITKENKDTLAMGMLLCLCVRDHFKR